MFLPGNLSPRDHRKTFLQNIHTQNSVRSNYLERLKMIDSPLGTIYVLQVLLTNFDLRFILIKRLETTIRPSFFIAERLWIGKDQKFSRDIIYYLE